MCLLNWRGPRHRQSLLDTPKLLLLLPTNIQIAKQQINGKNTHRRSPSNREAQWSAASAAGGLAADAAAAAPASAADGLAADATRTSLQSMGPPEYLEGDEQQKATKETRAWRQP